MQIGRVSAIATSALRCETQSLNQSAHNVANALTDGFEAQRVVPREAPGGGVQAGLAPTYGPAGTVTRDDGSVATNSNTDLGQERVTQLASLRAYQANIAVLRTSDEMLSELVRQKA
jgi:flagellar basal-body rod protein FlgC